MMEWLQVWLILLHGLFSQAVLPWPGTSVPVTPPPLSGMLVWYQAGTGNNCSGSACTDGASQDTFADQSGNGNTGLGDNSKFMTGSFTFKCQSGVYHTNQINGKPAVTFNGLYTTPGGTCFAFTSPTAILTASSAFVVINFTASCVWPSGSTACYIMGGNGGSVAWSPSLNTNHPYLDKACVVQFATSTATTTSGNWYQQNYTYDSSSGAYAFRVNRSAGGSGTSVQTLTGAQTGIGGNGCTGSSLEYLNGQIAEFILYNRVLSGAEITTVETYLNRRYGL